jgi:hypothetical protein
MLRPGITALCTQPGDSRRGTFKTTPSDPAALLLIAHCDSVGAGLALRFRGGMIRSPIRERPGAYDRTDRVHDWN